MLGSGVLLAYHARIFRGQVEPRSVCADGCAHVADEHPAGCKHPRHMPRACHRKISSCPEVKDMLIDYIKGFCRRRRAVRNRSDPYRQNKAHPGAHTDRLRCRRTYTRGQSGFTLRSSNGREPARPFRLRALAARSPKGVEKAVSSVGVPGRRQRRLGAAAAGAGAPFSSAPPSRRRLQAENRKRKFQNAINSFQTRSLRNH